MAKIVFVCVLALFALQDSAAHLNNVQPNLFGEISPASNVDDLIAELNKIINNVSTRFDELYDELKDKAVEIKDEANFSGLVADFSLQVDQLLVQDDAAVCEDVAHKQLREVERLASIIACKFEDNEELIALGKQLIALANKVENLLKEVGRAVLKCMKESHGNLNKYAKCMEQKIFNVKHELELVEKEIEETFNVLEQSLPVFLDNFSTCIVENKNNLVTKIQSAEEVIKTCINGNKIKSFRKSGFNNIADYLQNITKEIQVIVQLPEGNFNFDDKINEIISKHNIEAVVVEVKKHINELLTKHGHTADERLCGPAAHKELSSLAQEAQSKAQVCEERVQKIADTLEEKFTILAEHSLKIVVLLNEKILTCVKNHLLNMLGFAKCLEDSTEEVFDLVEQLQEEVRETLAYAFQAVEDGLKDLDTCLTKVEEKTISHGDVIVDTLDKCFNNVDHLF